jgi:hypothetical protein
VSSVVLTRIKEKTKGRSENVQLLEAVDHQIRKSIRSVPVLTVFEGKCKKGPIIFHFFQSDGTADPAKKIK